MGLFDNLGEKISELSDNAKESAKKVGNQASSFIDEKKTEYKINEIAKQVKDIKAKIGDVYFEKYQQGESLDVLTNEYCGQIEALLKNIEELRGAANAETSEHPEGKFCQNCGEKMTADAAFCPKCGMKA